VLVGNGSDEVLALCARAFVEPDGEVGFFQPSYSLYPVLAAIEGLATRPLELGPAFEWAMPAYYDADLFYLTNPNAPTGLLHPRAEVEAFARRSKGVVLVDEAYVDFAREHLMDLAMALPNVVVARTLSKSFSLAGLRVGYAVGPEALIDALYKVKDSYNVGMLAQALADAALSDPEHMRANAARIRTTRERVAGELRKRGFTVFPSEANFLWAKPPRQTAREVFEHLRVRRIFVRYFAGPRTGDYLRVTVGTDAEMDAFLAALPI
jgi:histidinol-phosphate aminotransferase